MAAPSTAYLFNGAKLPIHVVGVLKLDSLLALKLTEYGANIKALFYLDGLLVVKKGTDIGFIGFAYNAAKLAHHATARKSKIRVKLGANNCVLFNDGGLNTLADILISSIPKTYANRVRINISALSAYYGISSSFGVEYKLTTDSSYTEFIWSTLAIAEKESLTTQIVLSTPYARFDNINIRPFIVNPEGRYYGDTQTVMLQDLIYDIFTSLRSAACTATADTRVVYMKGAAFNAINNDTITTTSQRLGFFAYKDEDCTVAADDGFYLDFNVTDSTKIYEINLSGEIIKYSICAAPPAPTIYVNITLSVNGAGRVVVTVTSPITWTAAVTVSGNVQGYDEFGDPDSRYNRPFSISIGIGATTASQTLFLTYYSDFTYEAIDEGISPTSLDNKTLELTKSGI